MYGKELWTYLGRDDSSFSTGLMTPIAARASQLVVADANADGKADVLLVHREAGQVSLGWGNGFGGLQGPELLVTEAGDNVVSVYTVPRALLTEGSMAPRCPMVLHDGVAEGRAPEALVTVNAGTGNTGTNEEFVAVGDFDGNGHRDFALRTYERSVRLLLGTGRGTSRRATCFRTWT